MCCVVELRDPGVGARAGRERQRAGVAGRAVPRARVRAGGRGRAPAGGAGH